MIGALMTQDRRVHPRLPVRLLVQHQTEPESAFEVDYAVDLSQGGLFLQTSRALEPNSTLHLQFAPARDARVIECFCRVARVTPDGVGAAFLQLDDGASALLTEVLGQPPMVPMTPAAGHELRA
ncbi:MAG: PilZ domain-containing protein [Myxococcaceae bacterium]|nr:PilZ domain-containing protein [Myxococcaceae bacterium]